MNDIKWEHVILIVVLILLLAFGFIAGLKTMIGDKQDKIDAQQIEVDKLLAWKYWKLYSLKPPPHMNPLKQCWISSHTGYRMNPMGGGEENLHRGLDLTAPAGAEVVSVLDGVVMEHYPPPDGYYHGHPVFGGYIVIQHTEGLLSMYGHLSKTFVHQGDWIEQGKVIGIIGDTGISTGEHLHFEIVVDPMKYLEGR